jgi:UDP-N-acetylmuramoyl-L-alanyl-D-glutamate--2,6-diaminopimelate ligase
MMAALAVTAMTLGELVGAAAGHHAGIEITDLTLDSREVKPGTAFVALQGTREHGLSYAREAIDRGAAVVLYSPGEAAAGVPEPSVAVPALRARLGELAHLFYGRGSTLPELLAVTGTNGKTTVAYVVAQALACVGAPCGYIGTLGYGVPPELRTHALTTPDCFTLHRELRELGTPRAALEASSHALAQQRLAGLEVRVAALTNLSRDHLDHHGDLTRYAAAKGALFERPELEHAVLNVDDAFGQSLARRSTLAPRVLGVGFADAPHTHVHGHVEHADLDGLVVAVSGRYGAGRIRSRLIGDFNAENLLLALGALLAWDVPIEAACAALGASEPAPGRMEMLAAPGGGRPGPRVVVDYAHTPDALERVLASLRRQLPANGEIWCVFGCGGERDPGKRPLMGQIAGRGAEHVVITDDNPRREKPEAIANAILAGVGTERDVSVEHDRARAIRTAIARARPADLVLVAGKGHEPMQLVGSERRPFSDREIARLALAADA